MNRNLAILLMFGFGILGPCGVFALGSFASINALGRNPSSAPKIFTALVISLFFAFILSLIAMLMAFQLFSAP